MHLIAPSLLAADFTNLSNDIEMVNRSEADWFHLDVMDGRFVPNISFGMPVIKAIAALARKPLDVHLMIADPDRYIEAFKNAGANMLTVHYEACRHLHRSVQSIKEAGMKAGVAINPHTPVFFLSDIIADLDLVCLMSVNPGFGGQRFISNTFSKLKELAGLIRLKQSAALIEIDGGVDMTNAAELIRMGAQVLVAGNAVFSAKYPAQAIANLKRIETTMTV